ncbi:MAG: flavodoxin family protein [Candidatus Brocadiia bacterium]
MRVLIFASSPNKDGLTAECAQAALKGITDVGPEAEIVWLNDRDIGLCEACNRGWGTCREEHVCQTQDGFQSLHAEVNDADGYVLVNPVYFGELSESAKTFFDRLRRCEATRGEDSGLAGKPALGVAAAGGSGRGTVSCLEQMERLFSHLRCSIADLITVTQRSRPYKPDAVRRAARRMAESIQQ